LPGMTLPSRSFPAPTRPRRCVFARRLPSQARTKEMSKKNSPDTTPNEPDNTQPSTQSAIFSRRGFLKLAGASGFASAASTFAGSAKADPSTPDGTPEQVHLTWGENPTNEVVVSWGSMAAAANPHGRFGAAGDRKETVHAVQRPYTDGLNGEVVFTYPARLHGLNAGTSYQ